MSGEVIFPPKVEPRYRRLAWVVFLLAGAAATVGAVLAVVEVAKLVSQRLILQDRLQTLPPLPFVYICPGEQELFSFRNQAVHGGCGDDVSKSSLKLTTLSNGTSFRDDGSCQWGVQTVNIMDRELKGPIATTCVWFKPIKQPGDVPWRLDVYVMYDPLFAGDGDIDNAYGYGVGSDGRDLTTTAVNLYLSDFGGSNLAANSFFLRDRNEVLKPESQEKFEEGAVPLTPGVKSELRVIKTYRKFRDGSRVTKYPVDGALSTYPLRNMVPGFRSLHNIPTTGAQARPNLTVAYVRLSISYDEIRLQEQSLRAIVLSLVGVIPGYLGYLALILNFVFEPKDFDLKYTLSTVFAKPLGLVKQSLPTGSVAGRTDRVEMAPMTHLKTEPSM